MKKSNILSGSDQPYMQTMKLNINHIRSIITFSIAQGRVFVDCLWSLYTKSKSCKILDTFMCFISCFYELKVFIAIWVVIKCWPLFYISTNTICLFCSYIIINVKTMAFYATVIQMSGLDSYKTRFYRPIWLRTYLCQVRNKTIVLHSFDVLEILILPFDTRLSISNFPLSSVFFLFL